MTDARQLILVVDDEFTVVDTLVDLLEWEGYRVMAASNGTAGLALMEGEKPDLVLVDFMMPGMNGIEMLDQMRGDQRLRSVPAVLMTAAPMALPADGTWDALLPKPFGLDALVGTLRRLAPPPR